MDYYSCRRAYNSVVGGLSSNLTKKWVIDIDTKELKETVVIGNIINSCKANLKGVSKDISWIPTKGGYHLITSPFNVEKFQKNCTELVKQSIISKIPDIQKNNPTILYTPL